MKKLIALFLAGMLVMMSLAGCGNTDKEQGDAGNTGGGKSEGSTNLSWEEIKATIPEELKGTEITVYSWNESNAATGAVETIQNFERETGIKVNWLTSGHEDYATYLAAQVTGGDSPDIVRLRDCDFSIINMLTPLDELNYDFSDAAWNHEMMAEYKVNGRYYAAVLDDTPYFQPMVMYYNRNLIRKYSLEDPYTLWKNGEWTWDKCMEICKTFLDQAGTDYNGMSLFNGSDYAHSLGASFVYYDPETSQYVSGMSDTKLVTGYQYVSNNVSKGLMMQSVYQYEAFDNGIVLFNNDANIGARTSHFYFQNLKTAGALGTVPFPAVDGQEKYYQILVENEAYGIAKGAKNPEAAAYFLRYYLDAANYDMNTFYCDMQAKEVTEWCREQTLVSNIERIVYEEQYGVSNNLMYYELKISEPSQIKKLLDSYAPTIDMMVLAGNKVLNKLSE